MDSNQHNKSGFSFADDLMVDITGALFPGLLSIAILFVGVIAPLMIYDNSQIFALGKEISGSLWWVMLIVVLIVSYVIGHVSFRADILEPDRQDIKRRIREELHKGKKRYRQNPSYQEVANELCDQIKAFKATLKEYDPKNPINNYCFTAIEPKNKDTENFYKLLMRKCIEAEKIISEAFSDYPPVVLGVLFPEEAMRLQARGQGEINFRDLALGIQKAMNKYRNFICSTDLPVSDEATLKLIVCSCILNIQSELGCLTEENCTFPYVYYHKYLLKRNLSDYLDEVTWNADHTRSKNVINNYKIEIQMFAPEGYALVRKNEAHIRMSSSTWHMAQPLKWIMGLMSLAMLVMFVLNLYKLLPCSECCCYGLFTTYYGSFLSFLLPFSMLTFLIYIQQRITHFIHYQRMREIFYTISIYDDYKEIIADKKKVKTNQINYNVNIHQSKLFTV